MSSATAITAIKTLIFTIVVPGSVTVLVPYLLLSSRRELHPWHISPLRFLGIIPIMLGVFFYLRCAWDFTFTGGGTPAPIDPPKRFVAKGLYRIVRNPMYVGVTLILTGESITFQSATLLAYAAILWVGFHLFRYFLRGTHLKEEVRGNLRGILSDRAPMDPKDEDLIYLLLLARGYLLKRDAIFIFCKPFVESL